MKKFLAILLLTISVGCFAFKTLLHEEDWAYLEKDNEQPAITLPDSSEEYFNEWDCHESSDLKIEIVPVIYEGKKWGSPTILYSNKNNHIEYALDPEPMAFSRSIITNWKRLLQGAQEVCLVSSHLQNTSDYELRILQRIKTKNGIWDWFKESENYLGEQRGHY